uniref:NADH:flavin oxidoreductase/NADH oxidase N-terminal domain-containing protein n=1 Tax=Acrobeloides nanus TaxID=290746 RepID=A0A914BZG3_9BILA
MAQRWPIKATGDVAVLRKTLRFPTSRRIARNRLLKPPMTEMLSTWVDGDPKKSGIPTEKLINAYRKWGLGGFGLLITGNIMVDPKHIEMPTNSIIHRSNDNYDRKQAFKKCAEALKKGGGLAIAQLNHPGRLTPITVNEHPFAPSAVKHTSQIRNFFQYGEPVELTKCQIQTEVIHDFVYAAKFCHEAGFDGVELHAAFGYLLSEFLTPNTNKRSDEYGGSIKNRARIIREIYEGIRKEIPKETGFIVGIKVNTHEFGNKDFSSDDVLKFVQEFDLYGFDFIELSGGSVEELILNYSKMRESSKFREAYFQQYAQKIKPSLKNAVVYLTGGLRTVFGMVDAINNGIADGVGIGRPSLNEPDVAKKILNEEVQSVIYNHLEEDYMLYMKSGVTNLNEFAATTVEEAGGDLNYGVTDFSIKENAEKFKTEQVKAG